MNLFLTCLFKRDFLEYLFYSNHMCKKHGYSIIKENPVEYYLDELSAVRRLTEEKFAALEDSWLYQETDFWYGKKGNNFFKWFHVFEDEINHRGQIRLIRKLYRVEKEMTNQRL